MALGFIWENWNPNSVISFFRRFITDKYFLKSLKRHKRQMVIPIQINHLISK